MSVYRDGEESYRGAVIKFYEHMWMDGMLDEFAVVWDVETHEEKHIHIGYYGSDGCNMDNARAKIDLDVETAKDMLRTFKRDSWYAFAQSVNDYKTEIRKGSNVVVSKGRKVKPGTKLEVFWVGERPTYMSRQYAWMHETEMIAGCYDENGEKVWVKAEYLTVVDKIKSPSATERKKFQKAYVEKRAREYGFEPEWVK